MHGRSPAGQRASLSKFGARRDLLSVNYSQYRKCNDCIVVNESKSTRVGGCDDVMQLTEFFAGWSD